MALQRADDAHGVQGVGKAMAQIREPASKRRTTNEAAQPAQERQSAAERRAARAEQARRERQRRQRRNLLLTVLGVAALVGVVALLLWRQQAGQLGNAVMGQGQEHVADGSPLTYRYYPPASGPHYPSPQPAGVYRQEVPEGNWIHSLEHGYIVALVKCPDGCPDTFNQLEDLYKNGLPQSERFKTVKFVVTPYSKPFTDANKEAPITLLGWNRELMLQSVDRDKIIAFYEKYVDKGPEVVP
jgi:hypothetical protein